MIFNKNWYVPFDDFFSHLPNNEEIEDFGKTTRITALKYLKNKRAVVDIGAHIGISVKHWAKEFETVYAFEPLKEHFDCLFKNTEYIENIRRYNYGLSNFEGTTRGAYRSLKNSGSFQIIDSGYIQPRNENKVRNFVDIEIKKLDSFDFEKIDLIKIDVEGWEYEVVQGAIETIKKHRPVLMIEILIDHPNKTLKSGYDSNKLFNLLKDLNYSEAAHIRPDDKIFTPNE